MPSALLAIARCLIGSRRGATAITPALNLTGYRAQNMLGTAGNAMI
jgi:hypothetical protein